MEDSTEFIASLCDQLRQKISDNKERGIAFVKAPAIPGTQYLLKDLELKELRDQGYKTGANRVEGDCFMVAASWRNSDLQQKLDGFAELMKEANDRYFNTYLINDIFQGLSSEARDALLQGQSLIVREPNLRNHISEGVYCQGMRLVVDKSTYAVSTEPLKPISKESLDRIEGFFNRLRQLAKSSPTNAMGPLSERLVFLTDDDHVKDIARVVTDAHQDQHPDTVISSIFGGFDRLKE